MSEHIDQCSVPSSSTSKTLHNANSIKYNSPQQNLIFWENMAKFHQEYIQNLMPKMEEDHVSMRSPGPSVGSTGDMSPSTASSNSTLNSSRATDPPPLRYFEPNRSSSEHSYAVVSSSASTSSTELDRKSVRESFSSDSNNSTVADLERLCMSAWFPETLQHEVAQMTKQMFDIIQAKSQRDKELYVASRAKELKDNSEYNPNKRRLHKDYKSAKEAADRKRNNEASRDSRLRKKAVQKADSMKLDFDRQENAGMYFLHNWIEQDVYDLESASFTIGETTDHISLLRKLYGFFSH